MNDIAHRESFLPAASMTDIEAQLLSMPQPRIDVIHRFEPGHYIREMRAPAGTLVMGAHHKFHTLNVFAKGCGLFRDADGDVKELRAPMTFVSKPGRKVVYVTEDLVWQNCWMTESTDLDVMEAFLFEKDGPAQKAAFAKYVKAWADHDADREDFLAALIDIGMSEQQVDALTRNEVDQIRLPFGEYKFRISVSPINGVGAMCTADIEPGEVIGIARIGTKRTPLGRYINHSVNPNAIGRYANGNIEVIATRHIRGDGSLLCDGDEITVCYRESVKLSKVMPCQVG